MQRLECALTVSRQRFRRICWVLTVRSREEGLTACKRQWKRPFLSYSGSDLRLKSLRSWQPSSWQQNRPLADLVTTDVHDVFATCGGIRDGWVVINTWCWIIYLCILVQIYWHVFALYMERCRSCLRIKQWWISPLSFLNSLRRKFFRLLRGVCVARVYYLLCLFLNRFCWFYDCSLSMLSMNISNVVGTTTFAPWWTIDCVEKTAGKWFLISTCIFSVASALHCAPFSDFCLES